MFGYLDNGKPYMPDNYNNTDSSLTETVRTVLFEINEQGVVQVPFFFGPLSIIYFVSFFVSMLYYWGALQFVVKKIGRNFLYFSNTVLVLTAPISLKYELTSYCMIRDTFLYFLIHLQKVCTKSMKIKNIPDTKNNEGLESRPCQSVHPN